MLNQKIILRDTLLQYFDVWGEIRLFSGWGGCSAPLSPEYTFQNGSFHLVDKGTCLEDSQQLFTLAKYCPIPEEPASNQLGKASLRET